MKHPTQLTVTVRGIERYRKNSIVDYLLSTHPTMDMNAIARLDFSDDDRWQFAQLIGYSVSGAQGLSYAPDDCED